MANFFAELRRRNIYRVAAVCAVVSGCATPNAELPYYEPPSSGEASVPLATVGGRLDGYVVDLDPYLVTNVCAYVVLIDGQRVKPQCVVYGPGEGLRRATTTVLLDAAADIAVLPGRHTVVALLAAYGSRGGVSQATTTLLLDAVEGHSYRIFVARVSTAGRFSARVWIHDETTQTPVTEAKIVISPEWVLGGGGAFTASGSGF